jgi:hypothetical protein
VIWAFISLYIVKEEILLRFADGAGFTSKEAVEKPHSVFQQPVRLPCGPWRRTREKQEFLSGAFPQPAVVPRRSVAKKAKIPAPVYVGIKILARKAAAATSSAFLFFQASGRVIGPRGDGGFSRPRG